MYGAVAIVGFHSTMRRLFRVSFSIFVFFWYKKYCKVHSANDDDDAIVAAALVHYYYVDFERKIIIGQTSLL